MEWPVNPEIAGSITEKAHSYYHSTVDLLETIVNIDSYTQDKSDVERITPILERELNSLDFTTEYVHQDIYADQLVARRGNVDSEKSILLVGHLDTVFTAGTVKDRPFSYDSSNRRFHGPGVADMKGGIAVMITALRILKKLDISTGPIEVILTGDEEQGSPSSSKVIKQAAGHAKAAFVMEPGRFNGNVVVKRKGSGHGKIYIKGKASHSGNAFDDGISANVELAHKVLALHALNQNSNGTRVNCGIVNGGISNNSVPCSSMIHLHFSFGKVREGQALLEQFQKITDDIKVPGATARLEAQIGCMPMEATAANKRLFETVVSCAKLLNFDLDGMECNGASDAGVISASQVPCICGMGSVGGEYHTPDEYIEADSIAQRAALLALSIIAARDSF